MTAEGIAPVISARQAGHDDPPATDANSKAGQLAYSTAIVDVENSSMDQKEPVTSIDNQDPQPQTEADGTSVHDNAVPETPQFSSLHVDSQVSDIDSTLGTSVASSMMSVQSSLYDFVEENGRTYHKYSRGGKYYLPNDRSEQDRLDMQHELFKLALDGRLHLAPVSNPRSALDIGTGTGIWAVEYAIQNPSAEVTGTDLSPIQPHFVPPNCHFEVDDAEDDWVFHRKFSFIHGRALFSAFRDPAAIFKKAYAALAPGGYFEMQDVYFKPHSPDGTIEGTKWQGWCELLVESAKKLGRNWRGSPHYAQWMRDAGFENVVERVVQLPINTWPKGQKNKLMGAWFLEDVLVGVPAITPAVLTRSGMLMEEIETLITDVQNELKDKSIHVYYPFFVVYGRKPL